MVTVSGYTAARSQAIEDNAINSGSIIGDNLILVKHNGGTVDAGQVRPQVVAGSYTPTLTGMAIGTGGTPINTAYYAWYGGNTSGSKGILELEGVVRFGTTGVTLPSATALGISFPTLFQMAQFVDTDHMLGQWVYNGVGGRSFHIVQSASVNVLRLTADVITGTKRVPTATSSTIPGTWAINESIHWTARCIGAKV